MEFIKRQKIFYVIGKKHALEIICFIGLNNLHYTEIYREMKMNSGNLKGILDELLKNDIIIKEKNLTGTLYKLSKAGLKIHDFAFDMLLI